MIVITAILVLAIAATMLIGEMGWQRVRLMNTVDGALMTAASKFCRAMNTLKPIHKVMFMNTISAQIALLAKGAYPDIASGYLGAYSLSGMTIYQNHALYNQANKVINAASKEMRTGLYDTIFGALADEPKPYYEYADQNNEDNEIKRDPATGKIIWINEEHYAERESNFTERYRELKVADKKNWYKRDSISYCWDKRKKPGVTMLNPGRFTLGGEDPAAAGYDNFLTVGTSGIPDKIEVKTQKWAYIFFFCQPCCLPTGCCFWPGFVYNPWAWIKGVTLDSDEFGVNARKSMPFEKMPFFGRKDIVLEQKSRVKVKGNIWWTGFSFSMKPAEE